MPDSRQLLRLSKPAEFEQPGWPRRWALYQPDERHHADRGEDRMLPVPWVVKVNGDRADWTVFHPDCHRAHSERLCQVCGDALGAVIVLCKGHHNYETSGPGCHPRCAALALKMCPHFTEFVDTVAYRYEGDGLGYACGGLSFDGGDGVEPYTDENDIDQAAMPMTREQVAALAKVDPMGVGAMADAA